MTEQTKIVARLVDGAIDLGLTGRTAWALLNLVEAGERGCTPIDSPAPRWSGYVHKLRRLGIEIETITEPHGGPFAGSHGRYVLRSAIKIIEAS